MEILTWVSWVSLCQDTALETIWMKSAVGKTVLLMILVPKFIRLYDYFSYANIVEEIYQTFYNQAYH